MVTPVTPKPIAITITSGVKGQAITIRNRTNGDKLNETLGATAKHTVDLQNFASGYTAGDVIDISVSGAKIGANSLTTAGANSQTVTVGTASIQTTVSRGM